MRCLLFLSGSRVGVASRFGERMFALHFFREKCKPVSELILPKTTTHPAAL